jgi:hypothetical protein
MINWFHTDFWLKHPMARFMPRQPQFFFSNNNSPTNSIYEGAPPVFNQSVRIYIYRLIHIYFSSYRYQDLPLRIYLTIIFKRILHFVLKLYQSHGVNHQKHSVVNIMSQLVWVKVDLVKHLVVDEKQIIEQ